MTTGDFCWGVTSSAVSAEGAATGSDWYAWERAGRVPASGDGDGTAIRFHEDAVLLVEHELRHHMIGIDWARVEPRRGHFDDAALERYRERVEAVRAAGAHPWVTLQHVSLPGWFVDDGAFIDDRARGSAWPRYVDAVAETLGDLVAGWFPIIEPNAWAAAGYQIGTRPPGRHDPETAAKALRGIWFAWRDAWRLLRGSAPVATALDLAPIVAVDGTVTARATARELDRWMWSMPVSALRDGALDIPGRALEEVPDLRDSADLIGFTYGGAIGLAEGGVAAPHPADERVAATGRAPWVAGLATVLRRLEDEFSGRPLLVAGHGIATNDDEWRCDVVRAADDVIREARADGVDIRGYFHHTAFDGYAWERGAALFGLFDRDRNAKPSASLIAELARRR